MTLPSVTTPPVTTRILLGAPVRDALLAQVRACLAHLPTRVRLCIVQVGNHGPSNVYVRMKLGACALVGIAAEVIHLHEREGEAALHATLKALAVEQDVHAILLQTPLPHGWNVQEALNLVPTDKDIDGLADASAALRHTNDVRALLPATPLSILRLLEAYGIGVSGQKVAVIGKGLVVGKPLADMLAARGAEVVSIDKSTPNPAHLTQACDVIISAAGAPGLVTAAWTHPASVVIDAGLAEADTYGAGAHSAKLLGDADRMSLEGQIAALAPVPGGVGPTTVASLMTNICDAACLQLGRPRTAWVVDAAA